MKKSLKILLIFLSIFTGRVALASVSNGTITLDSATYQPSASIQATITADITNDSTTPSAWLSTEVQTSESGSPSTCSANPDPDVTPAAAATASGTAIVGGLTAPSTPGTYQVFTVLYEGDGCTGGLIGLTSVTFTVAAPPATTPTAVPMMPLWLLGLMATAIALIASVRIGRKK